MDYIWFIEQIFITIIIPLLGILTAFLIRWLNSYTTKIQENTNNELLTKYVGMLHDIIVICVVSTNQTYVNSLKEQGKFDLEAQKKAFEMTYTTVKEILSDEMIEVLSEIYEDLDLYIKNQIEYVVSANRITYPTWNNDNATWMVDEGWDNDNEQLTLPIDYNYEN